MAALTMGSRIRKILDRPLSLERDRIPGKIRMGLTPSGFGFLGLILCGFLMSVNFSNNLIFAMTFLLVSIALVGWYFTRVNIKNLRLSEWRTEPVFAGQTALVRLMADNLSGTPCHCLEPSARGCQGREILLPGRAQAEMVLQRPALQRGILPPPSGPGPFLFSPGDLPGPDDLRSPA